LTTERETRLLDVKAALNANGVAMTPRRAKLLEILLASERHPSVSEIHQEIQRYFPRTSLATVYNTIELLKQTGQVLEIELSGSANRYDGRRPAPHPHLICLRCEKVEDLDVAEFDEPLDAISAATGYQIVRRRTDYLGVCPDCQRQDSPQDI
jgi:Fur family peroxide stress response transcriptional regulator